MHHRPFVLATAACLLAACSSSVATPAPTSTPASSTAPTATAGTTTTPAPAASSTSTSATTSTTTTSTSTTSAPTTSASTSTTSTTVATVPGPVALGPAGDAFYVPPTPLPGNRPGDVIWARPIEDAPAGTIGWRVLYRSLSVAGEPIAVSGMVFAPATSSGTDVVVSWAHGTTGMGDQCAPSRQFGKGLTAERLLVPLVVGRGWTLVATDYEGLGTPGVHPYLVGESEGRGVLDIVRAARQLDGAGVDADSKVAIFGHSQGGQSALMASEIARDYAPELQVIGTVAGAPAGELPMIAKAFSTSGGSTAGGFGLMLDAGFLAAYPELPVDAVADAATRPLLDKVVDTCTDDAFALAATITGQQPDPTANAAWLAALQESSPGRIAPEGPILIFHGDADTTVPPIISKTIRGRYCALGATVQRTVYPKANHISVLLPAVADIQAWIAARVAGDPAPSNCEADQTV